MVIAAILNHESIQYRGNTCFMPTKINVLSNVLFI